MAPALAIKVRDKSDLPVLAEQLGLAPMLVTGDRDLLDLAAQAPISVLTLPGFWERLRTQPAGGE